MRQSLPVQTLVLCLTLQILCAGECWAEWIVPNKKIIENVDYSNELYIGRMRSDFDEHGLLRYTLRGPGVTEPPVGCFVINEVKGFVRLTQPLDREQREHYTLTGTAWYLKNNTIAEDDIKLHFTVEDQNDNPPVFIKPERSSIYEGSPIGTFVTQVVATDADKPSTNHTKIAYSLVKQEPNDTIFFAVDKDNGTVSVSNPTLDREKHTNYVLTIQAADMYGEPGGNSATTTVTIDITDVNDNIPTLEMDEYSASIDENMAPIEVLKIQALDDDEERTDNWIAEFFIVSGNEDGIFSIETDPKTNVGTLYLNKPVDFETVTKMDLKIIVANKAPPGAPLGGGAGGAGTGAGAGAGGAGTGAGAGAGGGGAGGAGTGAGAGGGGTGGAGTGTGGGAGGGAGTVSGASGAGPQGISFGGSTLISLSNRKTYPLMISVKNRPEAPKFKPNLKPISVSESAKNSVPSVIGKYTATEEDTGKTAENVKYAKGYDPDNWISIDKDTAEIKLNKVPDRESLFVVNGTYYAKILCITDELPSQTSTGTIALQVEDLNDNCPKLLDDVQFVCSDTRVVNVTAEDIDSDPNGAPLNFNLIQEKTRGKWKLQRINDVSVSLQAEEELWPGLYQVTMEIRDKQGLACPDEQVFDVEVCTCSEGTVCGLKAAALRTTSATFGAQGICFLLLGLLCLILLLLFLIKCECGNAAREFLDMPFDTTEYLTTHCTEQIGEDKDVLLMSAPLKLNNNGGYEIKMAKEPFSMTTRINSESPVGEIKAMSANQAVYNSSEMGGTMQESAFGGFYFDLDRADTKNNDRFQHEQNSIFMDQFITQKCGHISQHDSQKEKLESYDYEGVGSGAGSISSCSNNEFSDDLEFLNDLNSKFKTLAEVCGYKESVPHADAKILPDTVKTTRPTAEFTTVSSSHVTNTVQQSPLEVTVKPPLQTSPSQGMVKQESMYYGFNQPMQSNMLLSEDGVGQGVYIINNTPEPGRLLSPSNTQAFAHLGSGQQGILANHVNGDSIMYSPVGPLSPVMINKGLGEVNPAVVQNLSNFVMMPHHQLDGNGLPQMAGVPVGSMVSGQNGQGGVTLLDGSVSGGMVLVGGLGQSHHTITPQPIYTANSHELSGPVHMNQRRVSDSFSRSQNDGQGMVTILESPVNGGNLLVGHTGPPNPGMSQIATGQVNSQVFGSGPFLSSPNIVSGGGEGRLLVNGPIVEGPVSGGHLLVTGAGQYPVKQ